MRTTLCNVYRRKARDLGFGGECLLLQILSGAEKLPSAFTKVKNTKVLGASGVSSHKKIGTKFQSIQNTKNPGHIERILFNKGSRIYARFPATGVERRKRSGRSYVRTIFLNSAVNFVYSEI